MNFFRLQCLSIFFWFCIFGSLFGTPPLYNEPTFVSEETLPTYIYETSLPLSDRESTLIQHVKDSIMRALNNDSKLPLAILQIEGMSSDKNRRFLNNICSLPHTRYLEIGVWKGSTFISALYQNQHTIDFAIGMDDWSDFTGPHATFKQNCSQYLSSNKYDFYSTDCFKVNPSLLISEPINIYFYDGDHRAIDQEMAFTYYNDILDQTFIGIVDDWCWDAVRDGTYAAFDTLNYEVLYETSLPSRGNNGDKQNWWNGFYVSVIRKN